ncbi:hypothetical protein Dsin_013220 [Dipteronia sinensis]|uniref:Reverse transcriptase domain-containing protein n=1 Tax=Dipteronia sinensis TaxID=43782 RepID=A0AAE0EAD5_9ROSI|nr:hypothetical protein Dsin_013220 [Dipteronia sinensis]
MSNFIGELYFKGVQTTDPGSIREGILVFFSSHFRKEGWQRPRINGLNLKCLSDVQSDGLEARFTYEEVLEALNGCDGNKASGPDGLNLNFVKAQWEIIKGDFMNFINVFHTDNSLVKNLNATFIALIPKIKRPKLVGDYRPICLVGAMYKILAKILTNRLKKVMNTVIGESEMAFVQGVRSQTVL